MSQITITLLFLLFAIVMFMREKIPLGLTSMIVCVGLVVTDVFESKSSGCRCIYCKLYLHYDTNGCTMSDYDY